MENGEMGNGEMGSLVSLHLCRFAMVLYNVTIFISILTCIQQLNVMHL